MHAPPDFICEPIVPDPGTADMSSMARGEPGLPRSFNWRDKHYAVARVVSNWKTSTRDRGDLYLRKHWFEIETTDGARMTLYCDRQTKNRNKPKSRWWLYTFIPSGRASSPAGSPPADRSKAPTQ
jgi:hypothetical protein